MIAGNCKSHDLHPDYYPNWIDFLVDADRPVKAGTTIVIAWEPPTTDDLNLEKPAMPASASFLYQLTVAFPIWAGAILALCAFFQFGVFRIRPR